jgi:hypothetical protein
MPSTHVVVAPDQTMTLLGEKGYRTAMSSHGLAEGCYYFEVEILPPLLPLPFYNVHPSLRVGFASLED